MCQHILYLLCTHIRHQSQYVQLNSATFYTNTFSTVLMKCPVDVCATWYRRADTAHQTIRATSEVLFVRARLNSNGQRHAAATRYPPGPIKRCGFVPSHVADVIRAMVPSSSPHRSTPPHNAHPICAHVHSSQTIHQLLIHIMYRICKMCVRQ